MFVSGPTQNNSLHRGQKLHEAQFLKMQTVRKSERLEKAQTSQAKDKIARSAILKRKAIATSCFECDNKIQNIDKAEKFDEKTFCSESCELAYYEKCPECGEKATGHCKCMKSGCKCKNGHEWHRCSIHNMRGKGNGHGSSCNCVIERKAQPTDEEMLDFLMKRRKLSTSEKLDIFMDVFETTKSAISSDMQNLQPMDDSSSSDSD